MLHCAIFSLWSVSIMYMTIAITFWYEPYIDCNSVVLCNVSKIVHNYCHSAILHNIITIKIISMTNFVYVLNTVTMCSLMYIVYSLM